MENPNVIEVLNSVLPIVQWLAGVSTVASVAYGFYKEDKDLIMNSIFGGGLAVGATAILRAILPNLQ